MSKKVPSLRSPPNAPKKKKIVFKHNLDEIPRLLLQGVECESSSPPAFNYTAWRQVINSDMVRELFFTVLPEDVSRETNPEILKYWLHLYSPASQPQTKDEHLYVDFMCKACKHRETELSAPASPIFVKKP